ncbi:MAG: polyprenyl synthetase family protein [Sandaracinaceae bacterium]|nr:polyprenyl synthetase family protein [Sandaracinaceae bacterium]
MPSFLPPEDVNAETAALIMHVRALVEAELDCFFAKEKDLIEAHAPEAMPVFQAIESMTRRGGKRFRPLLLVAGALSIDEALDLRPLLPACAGLEILQSYLLIHDDWMDGDTERRGGPSAHVAIYQALKDQNHLGFSEAALAHTASALAILAGDLGAAWANRLVFESAFVSPHPKAVIELFVDMQRKVVWGQSLDLLESPDIERMHHLKTGSYTVEGPLLLGATLAGASDMVLQALSEIARPLGLAFQLRDDWLGTFGDPSQTGKPVGNDLRVGKRGGVWHEAHASLDPGALGQLYQVFGKRDASQADLMQVVTLLKDRGISDHIEAQIDTYLKQAMSRITQAPLSQKGQNLLQSLAYLIARRSN